MMTPQPPAWVIALALFVSAVPASAVFGLLAAWAWERFSRSRDSDVA